MLGISLGYYKHGPWLLSKENRRKIEPNETPSCLIPCLLVVFTWQLEILVTTLVLSTDLSLEIPAEFQYRKSKSRDPQVCQLQGKSFITHFTPRPDYTGMIWQPFHMSFWHLEFFEGKGWSGGHNMASVGRERVHCCNFLRSLYQCLAYFFNFFIFFLHCLAFFTTDRYKTCWYTWSKLNWSFDFVFVWKMLSLLHQILFMAQTHTHFHVKKGQQIIILLLAINYLQRKLFCYVILVTTLVQWGLISMCVAISTLFSISCILHTSNFETTFG